jgi:hypothetical protein
VSCEPRFYWASQSWAFWDGQQLTGSSLSFFISQQFNQVKLKFFTAPKFKLSQAQVFNTRNLASSSNNYTVYVYDWIEFESSLSSWHFLTKTQEHLWIKQNKKLIIFRSISDENSHFHQEINVYISDYINKKLKLKKSSEVKFCSSNFKSSYIFE